MTDRTIMLVETVLYTSTLAHNGEITREYDADLEGYAEIAYEIAEKAADAFATHADGWDAAYKVMDEELKRAFPLQDGELEVLKYDHSMKMGFCPHCKYAMSKHMNYCPKCGTKVKWPKGENHDA